MVAGNLGTQYKNKVLDAMLGGPFTRCVQVSFALYVGNPGATGTGGVEVVGNAYARPVYANDAVTWAVAAGAAKANAIEIQFATPTGAGWGTPDYFGVWDVDNGQFIYGGPITSPVAITVGQDVNFPAGTLVLQTQDIP